MSPSSLAPWRDLAAILLVLECAVLFAVPGVALFFAQKYLRRFRRWLRFPLLRVQVYALRVEHLSLRLSNSVIGIPITMQMLGARTRTTLRRLGRRRGEIAARSMDSSG